MHFHVLGLFLEKILYTDCVPLSKSEFLKAISKYLSKRTSLVSRDISSFCICGGKGEEIQHKNGSSGGSGDLLDLQQKHLEVSPLITAICAFYFSPFASEVHSIGCLLASPPCLLTEVQEEGL
ncbi:Kinesin KP1 [Abeliophyllum distichum]|uniref:Kinesin KP1 n=1 Tax=Abeliophyllum distichum TaxID=126358 RepID=A0ABD1QJK0_9LAMI